MKTISFTIVACISLTLSDVNSDGNIIKRQLEQNSTNRENKTQLPKTKAEPENRETSKLFLYNTTKRWLLGREKFNAARTFQNWFRQDQKKNKLERKREDREDAHKILRSVENFKEKREDLSVANSQAREIRILCLILTSPKNHMEKAVHVKATWGKRCTRLLFMSTINDVLVPTVRLRVKEGRDYLWWKVRAAFQYVYHHHRNDADWFLKADDDTYVILENLRYFLSAYNSSTPVYFGHRMHNVTQSYMHGGAGYVLSRAALDLFVKEGLPSYDICPIDNTALEDIEMGLLFQLHNFFSQRDF